MAVLGSTPGIIVGVGVGTAVSAAIEPALEVAKQEAWSRLPNRINDPGLIARLVAQGGIELGNRNGTQEGTAYEAARRHGYTADKLDQVIYLAQTVPGRSEARELWRRGLISDALWTHSLRKDGLDARYFPGLNATKIDILSPGELAAAIHRGLVPDPGLLRGEQPSPPYNVERYPVYDVDALKEALGSGYDHDRLGVLVGLQGLPMGTHEAAQALFKGILTHGDYLTAFNESNSRNEWAQAVLDNVRQIPTARDFLENALRGHHDLAWAKEQAARHGMSGPDAEILWQNQGRPLNLHQITQGLAWGAEYKPAAGDDPDPWMQAVLLGPVRPEYYELQHSLKYNLPSAFYFRTLQEQGVLSESEAETWYERLGWPPDLAQKVAAAYAKPAQTTAKENPWVAKADNQLWTKMHTQYVKYHSGRAALEPFLEHLIPEQAVRDEVFTDWELERQVQALPVLPA